MTRMTRKKKGIAVLVPALALVATATQIPAAAQAVSTLQSGGAPAAAPADDSLAVATVAHRAHRPRPGQNNGGNGQTPPAEQTPPAGEETPPPAGEETPPPAGEETPPPAGEETPPPAGEETPPAEGEETPPAEGEEGDGGGQAAQGPVAADYVPIQQVQPNRNPLARLRSGSRGTFTSRCGTNQNGHLNPDNHIVAPGVRNGAHHQHDYVGNLTTDGFSTDESLAAGGTTCSNGDKSAYFWPVMRNRNGQDNSDQAQQSAADGNVGAIVNPASVQLRFRGNPRSRVVAAPRFIRIITGDAKANINGPANARAQWTCSGFENRITDKYPLCPRGSQLTRILELPSCWDGQNLDSANHRTHVVFPGGDGACPAGTRAIPALQMVLRYNNLPNQPLAFAVDSFPEALHNPITDHADFHNVMSDRLMRTAVNCINSGRNC